MMKNIIALTCLILLLSPLGLLARIEILLVQNEEANTPCSGAVTLAVTGNAEDFTVTVLETGLVLAGVYGNVVVPDLCAGSYTFAVAPNGQTSCLTTLTAEVTGSHSLAGDDPPNSQENTEENTTSQNSEGYVPPFLNTAEKATNDDIAGQLNMMFSPNPAKDIVQVKVAGLQEKVPAFIYLHNGFGQQVYASRIITGEQSLLIDVSKFLPGVYFLSVQPEEGEKIVEKLIVH